VSRYGEQGEYRAAIGRPIINLLRCEKTTPAIRPLKWNKN
jgi:hypothetical protein